MKAKQKKKKQAECKMRKEEVEGQKKVEYVHGEKGAQRQAVNEREVSREYCDNVYDKKWEWQKKDCYKKKKEKREMD